MDINTITQLIASVGFPIAVCLVCFWYINKIQTQFNLEIEKMSSIINNNTSAIERLSEKLGK